MQLWQRN